MSNKGKLHRRIIKHIPIINNLFMIANIYATKGSLSGVNNTASLSEWGNRIIKQVVLCVLITLIFYSYPVAYGYSDSSFNPTALLLSVYPNLLGFGIAVFALFFALPSDFTKFIAKLEKHEEEESKSKVNASMLLSDLCYPLAVYSSAILYGFMISIYKANLFTQSVSFFFFIYGIFSTIIMITSIFLTTLISLKLSEKQ